MVYWCLIANPGSKPYKWKEFFFFLKRWTYMKAWSSYKQNFTEATWILPPISLTPAYRAFSNLASSALRWGNLKRDVALWKSYSVIFRPHYTQPRSQGLFTEKALVTRLHYTLVATTTSHFGFVFEKTTNRAGDHTIILKLSFSKSSVCKMFPVHTSMKGRRFQIPSVWRARFWKSPAVFVVTD